MKHPHNNFTNLLRRSVESARSWRSSKNHGDSLATRFAPSPWKPVVGKTQHHWERIPGMTMKPALNQASGVRVKKIKKNKPACDKNLQVQPGFTNSPFKTKGSDYEFCT
jgi:hypothetical protein